MTFDDDAQRPCAPMAGWDVLLRGYVIKPPKVSAAIVKREKWPIWSQSEIRRKILKLLREGGAPTGKEIAAKLREDVYAIGTVLGTMSRRGEIIKISSARKRWMLP
jgi:hypothetical protein